MQRLDWLSDFICANVSMHIFDRRAGFVSRFEVSRLVFLASLRSVSVFVVDIDGGN